MDGTIQQICGFLQQTLSPDPSIRRPAEKQLDYLARDPHYPVVLLNILDKESIDRVHKTACAIAFKNYIKRNWAAHEEDDGPNRIPENDRAAVKAMIVPLMLKSPSSIQKQLSETVSFIGKYDFPKKWPELIDEMVNKFQTGDFNIINGVLQTAHSLFKRYRFEFKSQALWEEIKFVLERISQPLTDLLFVLMSLTKVHEGNAQSLEVIYGSLVLVCKVFNSLNSQDLPEFFEDNMQPWMNAFHELLIVNVPALNTTIDEESGVLDHLKSEICENIGMYAQKYDEEFRPYITQFVSDVLDLLVKSGIETKYDNLVCNGLQFLSQVAGRKHYSYIFESASTLSNICQKIVIPNIDFRQSDKEMFEDTPEEYIRRDIEGSDVDTRRRAACDLIKTLGVNFEQNIFEVFSSYLQILLSDYQSDNINKWRAKDTAIFLVTSFASRGGSKKYGVTQTSELVPLADFCEQHIIPEIERPDINSLAVLKADAIKFVMIFRSLLGKPKLLRCLPQLIRHLTAESYVVHSYAACTIECVLTMKDQMKQSLITQAELSPFTNDVLTGLFTALSNPNTGENEYIMKAVMRCFFVLQEQTMPYMGHALPRLTEILTQVAKNPSRPNFNHYLFETLSLSIKIVCKVQPNAVSSFEEALFPVFQGILQQEVLEFMPYVFQMLSLLLETREGTGPIPDPYWALFPCLLVPSLWEHTSNITPLIRLLCAFIRQGSAQIASMDKLNAILGIFQKMIASRARDHEGFKLMTELIAFYPSEHLQAIMKQIFNLLFQRLSSSRTPRYVRGLIIFFCYYTTKFGASALVELIDALQANMFGMVTERVFIPEMNRIISNFDRKMVLVGTAMILTECPRMLAEPYVANWPKLLQALIELIALPPVKVEDEEIFADVENSGYSAGFSQIQCAKPTETDFLAHIPSGNQFLLEALAKVSKTNPDAIRSLIATLESDHQMVLQKYCLQANVHLF